MDWPRMLNCVLQAREKVSGIQPVLWHNFICWENMHPPWQAPSSALVRRTWQRRSAAGSCPGYKSWECSPCGGSTECRHQDFSASASHPGWGRRRRKWQPEQRAQRFPALHRGRRHSGLVSPENKRQADLFHKQRVNQDKERKVCSTVHRQEPLRAGITWKQKTYRLVCRNKWATRAKRAKICSTAHRQKALTAGITCQQRQTYS